MPHDHHGHAYSRSVKVLVAVLVLTTVYTVVEAVGGLLTGSLALLADAGHMLSDSSSIAIALIAMWLAQRPATSERSFGFKRAEILAALANGVALVAVSIWIVVEAGRRLDDSHEILGGWMLAVAGGGVLINLAAVAMLVRSDRASLNLRAALAHVFADLLGSLGVVLAAIVILATGWGYVDPLVSLVIAALVLVSAWGVLRESVSILLESTPRGIDADEVRASLLAVPAVADVHDLHIWTITSGFPALSAHVLVERGEDCHGKRRELERLVGERYGIDHTTLQVDHVHDELLRIQPRRESGLSSLRRSPGR